MLKKCLSSLLLCLALAPAEPLRESAEKIDITGILMYKLLFVDDGDQFYQGLLSNHGWQGLYTNADNRAQYLAGYLGLRYAMADNFSALISGYFAGVENKQADGQDLMLNPKIQTRLRQFYITYHNDYGTRIDLGRQFLGTIWTYPVDFSNEYGPNFFKILSGSGVRWTNDLIWNTTISAFAFDSIAWPDSDLRMHNYLPNTYVDVGATLNGQVASWLIAENFYGGSIKNTLYLGEGNLRSQFWLGYLPRYFLSYAASGIYDVRLWGDFRFTFMASYFGNKLRQRTKNQGWGDGSFYKLAAMIGVNEWSFGLGSLKYGLRDKKSFVTLEDQGALVLYTPYIYYIDGSNLNGDLGENDFTYALIGFKPVPSLLIRAIYSYGTTTVDKNARYFTYADPQAADPIELKTDGKKSAVGLTVSLTISPRLSAIFYYTMLNLERPGELRDYTQGFGYFQLYYKF